MSGNILKDERGHWSGARTALAVTLLVALGLIVLEAAGVARPSSAGYTLLSTILVALISWAAGPRVAQYLGPQIGAVAAAVSGAKTREPNLWRDDERKD